MSKQLISSPQLEGSGKGRAEEGSGEGVGFHEKAYLPTHLA